MVLSGSQKSLHLILKTGFKLFFTFKGKYIFYRGVAQSGRAQRSGR